ncbi:MAG: exosortase W [Proteobacteria bacterium]|nr:exosortase W [Pseudomonadota bacterium]
MSTLTSSYNSDSRRRFWLAALVLSVFFTYSFAGVLYTLLRSWYFNAAYSHGFLVLIISIYLIWNRKEKLALLPVSPNLFAGAPLLLFSLISYLIGDLGGILALQELALIIAFTAIVLLTLGTDFLKNLLFPILYLLFMLTSWDLLTERLHEPFQHISAVIGTELMQFLGVPAYRESVFIELPNITLEVARVCSGVNYLVAVAAIGVPLAYIALNSWKRRVILVVYGLIMAVIANGVRVALIGTLAYYNLSGDLHGPLHTLHAMFVAVAGYVFLFIGVWFLSDRHKEDDSIVNGQVETSIGTTASKPYAKVPYIFAVVTLFIFGSIINFNSPMPTPLERPLSSYYSYVPEWSILHNKGAVAPIKLPGVDAVLLRTFQNESKVKVHLYAGYYEYQVQGKELISYKLNKLHDGASRVLLKSNSDGKKFEVNRAVTETPEGSSTIYFWYETNGTVIASRLMSKVYSSWHSFVDKHTEGALVVVTIDRASGNALEREESAKEFIESVAGRL